MDTLEITIDGMSCGHCVAAVRDALSAINNVASVDVEIGVARVRYHDPVETDSLRVAIEEEGYSVSEVAGVDS